MHREVVTICMDVDNSEEEWRGTGKLGGLQRVDEEWTRLLNRRTKATTEMYAFVLLTVFYCGPGVQN